MDRLVMLPQTQEPLLPPLRNDLKLLDTSSAEDGSKRWLLFDPIQNKYFTIGIDAFELISHWQSGITTAEFLKTLEEKNYAIDAESLQTFIEFLSQNNLIVCEDAKSLYRIKAMYKHSRQTLFKWLLHNYLFIRIPLVKPDRWLDDNLHRIDFLYSKLWQNIVLILGFIGIIFILRDWTTFSSTFLYFFSQEGAAYYFLSLAFVKSFHELGHAFSAKRFGCKVPTMGVAFLVLFPVLYTDTTSAWKLKSNYQRLQIVLAGIKVELYLALIATFLWSFAPIGVFKSILFIIATTSWTSSLLINISPFLRFDGYYALADLTDTQNLQPRSFAMAKWFLRHHILGLEQEKPELLTKKREVFFIVYAIATWIYRFFLFAGIAALVYYFAFKALGIILFVVEVAWFIFLPIYKEINIWWKKRGELTFNRKNQRSLLVFLLLLAGIFLPWHSTIKMPAVIESKHYFEFYPIEDGYIESIFFTNGAEVKQGDLLMKIRSSEMEFKITQVKTQIEQLKQELDKQAGFKESLDKRFVLQESLLKSLNELEGLEKIRQKFDIKANFDGKVYLYDTFKENQWVSKTKPIFVLYDDTDHRITAFCNEYDMAFLKNSAKSTFFFHSGDRKDIHANVNEIAKVSSPYLEFPELASVFGGKIATRQDGNKRLKTEQAYYKIIIDLNESNVRLRNRSVGTLLVEGESSSLITKVYKKALSVLIRESEF
jgi:putative peptide zinc metalloprotease protein